MSIRLKNGSLGTVSCTGGCKATGGGGFVWEVSTLAAHASQSCTIKVVAEVAKTGVVVLTAASSTPDLHPFNNVATRHILIVN